MKATSLISIFAVSLFFLSLFPYLEGAQGQDELPKWTFMVYLDADNNLEDAGIDDVNEMEEFGSTDDVNIVVQMDRIRDYDSTNGDWDDCRRFYIEKDLDRDTITSPEQGRLGEVNMGDPETLIDFVSWSVKNYPAQRYALILWNHGGAFRGVCFDDTVPGLPEGEYDALNMSDVNYAAEEIYKVLGNRKMDLWGFDACLMAQVAVMYELKDFVKVGVGSGYNEPGDGWPYDEILGPLTEKPGMDEKEFAAIIVHEYIYSYNNKQQDPQDYPMVTQAAFDLELMDKVVGVLDEFSEELGSKGPLGGLEYLLQIYQARKNCNSYDMANVFVYDLTGYPLYDVIDFTKYLDQYIADAFPKNNLIQELTAKVRETIKSDIPGEGFMFASEADQWHPDANGLSMYFPNKDEDSLSITQLPTNYLLSYEETSFAREHLWDEFLHSYYGIDPIEDSDPTITITSPQFNTTFPLDEGTIILRGVAYDREMIDRVEVRVDNGEWTAMPGISGQGKIPFLHQMNSEVLGLGTHRIEVRAFDRPVSDTGGNVGKSTSIVHTEITIQGSEKSDGETFKIPQWFLSSLLILIIAAAFILGVVIFRGRNE